MLARLLILGGLGMAASTCRPQVADATQNSSVTNHSQTAFAQLRQKWTSQSPAGLLKAAQQGDAAAQYFYWVRKWKEASAHSDHAASEFWLLRDKLTNKERDAAATKWKAADEAELRKAVAAGNIGAREIAAELEANRAVDSAAQAFEWVKQSAEQGFPAAEYDAAINYLGESGWVITEANRAKGLTFLERAADHDWAPAQYKLGMIYASGQLLPPDPAKAVKYLQQAADQGGPLSEYQLAQLYAEGVGEPRSTADSPVALLRRSAFQGCSPALRALAERYRTGLGVPIDYVQAIRYYQAASEANETTTASIGANSGGVFDLVDRNLEPKSDVGPNWSDFATVLSAYLKATSRADSKAMIQLGIWCQTGQFTPENPIAAYYWFNRAAACGAATAVARRNALKDKLSPKQLQKAAKLYENTP